MNRPALVRRVDPIDDRDAPTACRDCGKREHCPAFLPGVQAFLRSDWHGHRGGPEPVCPARRVPRASW